MGRLPLVALCLGLAVRLAAAMPALSDNGRAFCLPDRRLALACLDEPGLLSLGPGARDRLLDRAARAGFTAVSFDAPLFGPGGLVPKLGAFGGPRAAAFTAALRACARRRLYAFPVLYPPAGVDGLVGTATARAVFFAGRRAWGWERWALAKAAGLEVGGAPLTRATVVGGWLLYSGPWPGGAPLAEPAATGPAAAGERRLLQAWTAATVRAARVLGFRQELGEDLWLQDDLARDAGTPPEAPDAPASAGPPVGPLAGDAGGNGPGPDQAAALDALPPVAGDASGAGGLDDSAILPPVPGYAGPDALDWGAVRTFLGAYPRATQLDFMEITLDSEDWFGAGDRLAGAAGDSEVPVLWRQDWRQAPRYERSRHLEAPQPLAGLAGPWPGDDWPGDDLWPWDPGDPTQEPFGFRGVRLERGAGGVRLSVETGRPAALDVSWGPGLPFRRHASLREGAGTARTVPLGRVAPGAWFLLKIMAHSRRYGACVLRTQWVRAPR